MEPEFLACSCLCGAAEAVQPASSSAGDFVDRGAWGLETLLMLACWKMLLPGHFFLVRGNHECTTCTHMYGFRGELLAKFKSNKDFKVPLSPCTPLRLPPFFGGCLPPNSCVQHHGLSFRSPRPRRLLPANSAF